MQQQQRRHPARCSRARPTTTSAARTCARASTLSELPLVAPPGRALGPAQSPQAARARGPARARPQRRISALSDAGRRLAARDRHAGASRLRDHRAYRQPTCSRRARGQAAPAGRRRTRSTRRAWSGSSGASSIPRRAFLADLLAFQPRIAVIGAVNGLAQTLLKLTAPGVPDTYQGCELWDLSLVDPDNRRPVDFELGARLQQTADAARSSPAGGRPHQAARHRARSRCGAAIRSCSRPGYEPLEVVGAWRSRGRVRPQGEQELIVVIVPRLIAALLQDRELPCPAPAAWGDTRPPAARARGRRSEPSDRAAGAAVVRRSPSPRLWLICRSRC